MKTVWAVAVATLLALAAEAYADTLYLKDGRTVWGSEIGEDGDQIVVRRSGETLRFPKGEAVRIERSRVSIPRYYEPPAEVTGAAQEGGDRPRPAGGAVAPAPTQAPGAAAPAPAVPSGPPSPTRIPPPPPPVPLGPR